MTGSQTYRLENGGLIERGRPLTFTCNGRRFTGYAGDTLASALLANGVRVVGRSFKYHRPRGILAAGVEETNALFRIDSGVLSVPLVRATMQPLVDGLSATTENSWPSIGFDFGRVLDFTHWFWPAGFYNKTFKWPSWHWYEGLIRRSAGSGRLPTGPDASEYFQHNLHCDVLVVGGGQAGLREALAASREGARVVIVELETRLGGSLRYERGEMDNMPALQWLERAVAELGHAGNVRVLTSTLVTGYYDHDVLVAVDRSQADDPTRPVERLWKIRAQRVVLATGAIEQPLVFANNDRPGIMLAGAVRRYLAEYAVTVGREVVVATNNNDAYLTAFDLHAAGVQVPVIVDARVAPAPELAREAASRRLEVIGNAVIVDTAGTRGVREVHVRTLAGDGRSLDGAVRAIRCDALAMSGGWSPTVHLYSQAGGKLRYDELQACFVPDRCAARVSVVGAANGDFGRPLGIRALSRTPSGPSNRQWIDFRHDVTAADIELAARENFSSVEHMKRYTTTGMSIDQGKTSNLSAMALLAEQTGRTIAEVGTTTFRPMYSPVSMGALSAGINGDRYAPRRLMPTHGWHAAHGADFNDYGSWQRPACYPRPGESRDAAIEREVRATRNAIGLFDGSPLGKIEVKGPDAAEFLNRIYVNNALTLKPGQVRYGLMLSENGIVIDDGVFVCMASEHYLVCTTSGGADRIAMWMDEWHQCEWPELRVVLSPVTTQWAVLTLAGPKSRELLTSIESDIDFSVETFPHLSFRAGRLAGDPVRVQRVSFSGEVSFEVSVPARRGESLWETFMAGGQSLGIEPIGVEALMVLRTEKGFLHVGSDTDGTSTPLEVGFAGIVAKKQRDFVGRRSLTRPSVQRPDRRQFVGLEPINAADRLVAGSHLVTSAGGKRRSEGFVTSACLSPTLGKSIGLGLLERGFSRQGELVTVFDEGRSFEARVVAPSHYDPTGERMNG
jgi:sarcosine oxidase subunit alpha